MSASSSEWIWYARAPLDARAALTTLRVEPAVEWALIGGALWLRGRERSAALDTKLAAGRAVLLRPAGTGGLVRVHPPGLRVPTERVPEAGWMPAAGLVDLDVPVPALAGTLPGRVTLRVVRGGAPRPPAALRLPLEDLVAWADQAPAARLEAFEFAADASGDALVLGPVLPPLAGALYWEEAGVLLPAGHRLEPNVDAATAREVLASAFPDTAEGDRFLMEVNGASRIPASGFVRAGRAALRATRIEVHGA